MSHRSLERPGESQQLGYDTADTPYVRLVVVPAARQTQLAIQQETNIKNIKGIY